MSMFFPRKNYLYNKLDINFLVEAKILETSINLRTWRVSKNISLNNVVPAEGISTLLKRHVEPFTIESNRFGILSAYEESWIPLATLPGTISGDDVPTHSYICPISQISFTIDEDMVGKGAWSDFAIWSFNAKNNGNLEIPFNRYEITAGSKSHGQILSNMRHQKSLLTMYVPYARGTFENFSYVLNYSERFGCVHNFQNPYHIELKEKNWRYQSTEQIYGLKALFPSLRLSGPDTLTANQAASYKVEMYSKNTDTLVDDVDNVKVYLESHAGYLPQRQVEISQGEATFPLIALGLSPGDRIKLKVGWRNFSGAAEKIITVI